MEANPLAIAMIFLSIFASNAFGVLRSPYPGKPFPPDHIIVIGEEEHDRVQVNQFQVRKTNSET